VKRSEFRFFDSLRVRWAEVDMQKIVFNGHYLMYFDTAVAGYWRAMALPYHETMEHFAGDMFVRKASVEYLASARYDDQLEVGLRLERIGSSSMLFVGAVFRGEKALVTGELVYVFADPATQTSRPVPPGLRELLLGFEAGAPVLQVGTGPWSQLEASAHTLREAVFVREQEVPAELEWDADDATALHALARNRLGLPLGTGRLVELAPGVGKIGRMAVRADMRGSGVGAAVLQALVNAARERGLRQVVLHAQLTAAGFYRRAGFSARGGVFDEVGIPHQEMVLALDGSTRG
jgi:YbgC/YbaW family acyl-CoA thioester hydrolase